MDSPECAEESGTCWYADSMHTLQGPTRPLKVCFQLPGPESGASQGRAKVTLVQWIPNVLVPAPPGIDPHDKNKAAAVLNPKA